MAVVYIHTIIYFTLVIHESLTSYDNRNLCLETVARFMDYQYRCSFELSTAQNILQDDTTCPFKCNIWIKNLHNFANSLQEVDLTIGNEKKIFNPCLRSYLNHNVNLSINCSSWNEMKYITWDDVYACSINDAHCVQINNYCVCHCLPGYFLANKKCLKKMVNIGGICEFDWQCNGTQFANVCDHGICSCSPGYIQINRTCYMYQENVTLNDPCELTEQCSQPFSVCFQGKCQCINGYFALDRKYCLKDTVPVGGFCSLHEQCTGSNNSGVCKNGRCTCTKGFTFIYLACEESNAMQI
ncbi:prion-like-(Q/N-rich) domain-bearing protein 25 [Magallana gigas]|uniref:prion-like-(Q/N-rich) domain-bearing protein 25 n=1 Tax=Magallana gigas TaxID=29159 RepID=UPI003340F861